MKKIILILVIAIFSNIPTFAIEQDFSIADAIRSFMLPNNSTTLNELTQIHNDGIKFNFEYHAHPRVVMPPYSPTLQKEWEIFVDHFYIVPEYSFYFYPFITMRYAKQYADTNNFNMFVKQDKIWFVGSNSFMAQYYHDKDLTKVKNEEFYSAVISDIETVEFLNNAEKIEKMVQDEIDEKIVDCKIVAWPYAVTFIYLKGENTDHGIKIYDKPVHDDEPTKLENFKIYTVSEIIDSIANYNTLPQISALIEKPTYETEAIALQNDGLIQGNENGLDLLKPLSRIEAATILVRALGYENEPTETISQFIDIPNDNWAVKYANIAKEKGLSKGVGDNKFAPDERVTSDQFATLLLRNFEADDFDWQTATQMLIDKGIITTEQSETMDLFTRGDMAKIIYEAKQKGLIN